MPRLLLVDDNPSIHKIAETLLSSSPIELMCVESGSEAMMLLDSGERFDVALLDTVMPGMDGWELLAKMRKHPESAFIPIAMMAGVLDTVDPNQLTHAPIQGFLKKPIELRELADRVQQLLATPVTLAERGDAGEEPSVLSPFSTVPGTKISNLPEFREAVPETPSIEDDLLVLTPEDFWPAESAPEISMESMPEPPMPFAEAAVAALMEGTPHPAPAPEHVPDLDAALDLEELDLEALKDLHVEAAPATHDVSAGPGFVAIQEIPAPEEEIAASLPTIDLSEQETLAIPGLSDGVHDIDELPDLGEVPDFESVVTGTQQPPVKAEEAPFIIPGPPIPEPPVPSPVATESPIHEVPKASFQPPPWEEEPVAHLPAPMVPPPVVPALGAGTGEGQAPIHPEIVQALLADPALLDALAKAVVARLGDQVLREIAWEVMPELAEKLPR